MGIETIKILTDAGLSATLAITLLVAIFFLSKSQGAKSSAAEHDSNATQMTAKSNLLLAEALDRFSAAATRSAELAALQQVATDRNYASIEAQKTGLNHIGAQADLHDAGAVARDVAAIARNHVTTQAIEALPGKIQLVMQADSNELMLQIQVALRDFMSRLKIDEEPGAGKNVIVEVNTGTPEPGEVATPIPVPSESVEKEVS